MQPIKVKEKRKIFGLMLVSLAITTGTITTRFFFNLGIDFTHNIPSHNLQIAQGQCPEKCCEYRGQYYPVGYKLGQLTCTATGVWV
ncbi:MULTISPECIES: hypothetical protein [Nostoc]|uniref:Uncharacterized protein n=2 Tax=Nostoc TaxID=1177 RepID=A0ABR8IF06_9NOSO|nr:MULTISPECIES: hypothetical protein [Nostoc]MBD2564351.1 hypothetical protein [Nostoc linckia FACHB-391]MBD2650139.1 hypothetical protein [Nostoc foliaceum FACHB-393]